MARKSEDSSFCRPTDRRGLSRGEAAEYIGIGVSKFDTMVSDGRMPPPKRIDGRCVWDRHQVDRAFDLLEGGHAVEENPWEM
jgi:predicted DNA-binding transcriptional regulator AlpA